MYRAILTFVSLISFMSLMGQHNHGAYCSKYKAVTPTNRLAIQDFRSDSVDILHTSITLDMRSVSSSIVVGQAEVRIQSRVDGVETVRFDFEGMVVDSVRGAEVSSFNHVGATLNVLFAQALNEDDISEIEVFYSGTPMQDASGWGGFYFSGDFAWNLGVGFADDPHSYGRIWFPCFDNFIERSTFDFHVRVNSNRMASCNGLLTSVESHLDSTQTYHWELDQPIPSYLACVSVGPYRSVDWEVNASAGLLPIQIFGRENDSANIMASFNHLSDAVLKFEEAYGPYRFDKVGYSLVPFNSGAMEHATNITYPIYAVNGGLSQEDLMAHELAHMWWGDNVTCQTDGDMWINEGWASFSEYLFREEVYGRDAYEASMKADLKYMLQFGHHYEESYRPISGQPHEYVYGDHVYKKGALAAHNLRGYMGDELFFSAIDQFMEQFKYSPVSSDSLEKYFSQYSGIDLENFFRDWIFTGGYNVVVLDSFKAETVGAEYEISLFLQQKLKGREAMHDNLPVYYTIFNESWASESGKVEMSGQYEEKVISSAIAPFYIVLYEQNELAQARTRDEVVAVETGDLDLNNMYWDVAVTEITDSAKIFFDHIWSYPDPIKDFDAKPYRMSNYHYWKIGGLGLDHVYMNGQFFYDGREGGNTGFLDMDLVSTQEDSLVLLYRPTSANDWGVYKHYEKNILGTTDNGFGLITLDSILAGEYTLANLDRSVLATPELEDVFEVSVYPNPGRGEINILIEETESNEGIVFELYSISGKLVVKEFLADRHSKINTSDLAPGLYTFVVAIGERKMSDKVIIE